MSEPKVGENQQTRARRVSAALGILQEFEQRYAPFSGITAMVDQLIVARHEYWSAYEKEQAEVARPYVSVMTFEERTARLQHYAAISAVIAVRTPEVIEASRYPTHDANWMQGNIVTMHRQQDKELQDLAQLLWPQPPAPRS